MRKGKDHMEIRRIDHFGPPLIHPDFLVYRLAAGTVTVAAGIVVELRMSAVRALRNIDAKRA